MHLLASAVSKLVKGHSCSLRLVSQKFKVIFVVYFLLSHARFKVVIEPFQTRRHFSCKKNVYVCSSNKCISRHSKVSAFDPREIYKADLRVTPHMTAIALAVDWMVESIIIFSRSLHWTWMLLRMGFTHASTFSLFL